MKRRSLVRRKQSYLESGNASVQNSSNYCSGYSPEKENSEENGDLGFQLRVFIILARALSKQLL